MYDKPMDRKFSDTAMSNIQINKEVIKHYMIELWVKLVSSTKENYDGVDLDGKNKQTHVIVVNKKDKNQIWAMQ